MNLRKRARRPAEPGRHTSAAVRQAKAADAGEHTAVMHMPGLDGGPGAVAHTALPARTTADVDVRRGGARLRSDEQPPADLLRRLHAGLRNLDTPHMPAVPAEPGAYLRAIMPDGNQPWEPLNGAPVYAGRVEGADGRRYAGLYLGDEDQDGRLVVDATRRYLLALRGVVDEALADLNAEADEALTSLENDLDAEGRPAA